MENVVRKAFTNKVIKQLQGQARDKLEEIKPILISKYLTERTSEDHGHRDFIVSFNHPALFKWDLIIIGLAIWNSIFIPFELAFEPAEQPFIVLMNACIELFFMIDIGLAFRTSYLTFEGEEIMDPHKIAHRYVLEEAFIFDLLSVIPFNLMTPGVNLKVMDLLGVLKLVHVTRLPHLVAKLNMGEEKKAVSPTLLLSFLDFQIRASDFLLSALYPLSVLCMVLLLPHLLSVDSPDGGDSW